jgi:putative ribosome biogenesis GTPase RsgA
MDVKVNGKELHQLSARELRDLEKQVKLALAHAKKNGFRKFQVGDIVKVEKSNWSAQGVIEAIGARTATVNIGDETILATPRMISKV